MPRACIRLLAHFSCGLCCVPPVQTLSTRDVPPPLLSDFVCGLRHTCWQRLAQTDSGARTPAGGQAFQIQEALKFDANFTTLGEHGYVFALALCIRAEKRWWKDARNFTSGDANGLRCSFHPFRDCQTKRKRIQLRERDIDVQKGKFFMKNK